ncbi:MAG: OmpA family protein [Spirochaetaceae bacterium]|jgi:outer membrane protein OmpA-like peptidoglycan-associated protein|nr:OmpA family protein [Spirochaetaceae bacterium]
MMKLSNLSDKNNMRNIVFKSMILMGMFVACTHSPAQNASEPATLAMSETGPYSIVERSDWRRYNNGKYIGLVRHEVRASIMPKQMDQNKADTKGSLLYQGNFFVLENTLRDMRQSAQAVDSVVPVSFQIHENGTIKIDNDRGFPTLRGFPTFPSQQVMPGFRWKAPGNRAVDPLNTGRPVIVPFIADYEYKGREIYKFKNQEILVHRIYATYACQYQNRPVSAQDFTRVQGSHKVDILIRVEDGLPLFMRDDLDETYGWADGSTVQFKGFTLTFGAGIVPMDRGEVIASLGNVLKIEKLPDPDIVVSSLEPEPAPPVIEPAAAPLPGPLAPPPITIRQPAPPPRTPEPVGPALDPVTVVLTEAEDQSRTPLPEKPALNTAGFQDSAIDLVPVPEGIRLTVKDIRFAPDSADFLPSEKPRLDLIAEALKQIPDRSFLVEGHTAATGRPAGEMELSIERAKCMVDELVSRGISADRFIYKGWGGTRPIGDNSTSAGRSRNRRVEITILE